jgi:putative NIF3 family GTP cyclohydrolase 1 type 2
MSRLARRVALCVALLLCLVPAPRAPVAAPARPPTAQEIVDRIRQKVGCTRPPTSTVDTVKAGDGATPVTGIATTFTASVDVLQRAAAAGQNLIIAHEPTFYEHREDTRQIEGDPVLEAKRALLKKHRLVVWRFHDLAHCRQPDVVTEGLVAALGWQKHQRSDRPATFALPPTSLRALAAELRRKLDARAVRVVGKLDARVARVGLLAGASDAANQIRLLARPDIDVLVAGESREWETVEYVRDAVAQGRPKALILLGHVPSEERGMQAAATWLRSFVPEVPVAYVPAGDPFSLAE